MPRVASLLFPVVMMMMVSPLCAFEFPSIPNFLKPPSVAGGGGNVLDSSLAQKEAQLLETISNTQNGRTAAPPTQAKVLSIVREIEKSAPFGSLSNPEEVKGLDGTWYLQYTSPSQIDNEEELVDTWTPVDPVEYGIEKKDKAIETEQFTAKGTVSAVGITVDTSSKVVKQIFDVGNGEVANEINFDWGKLTVRGPFVPSEKVSNRAIVAFKELLIELENGPGFNLGFLFSVIKTLKGSDVGGWLETTHLSDDIRIGRGNKGTMFVLTRDLDAVKP
mmetsp:Transcript_26480/g.58051  ORF Transcript_26480/g.58051 Transcript_26480/m.58051 type:complete len:276 (+) Transcript_26480:152-979(+)|eukprot:CAMPEP_0178507452 /NCGR_PEP_ID=MMETSP0696-20121128/20222_1 /TAXON_ID=265572 /ORGANISM="Extubocellulus spinifer, Strain CCMP396" /LENGTH=275 /DNA_ID=CAMNT_0020136931 /DNA_START=87 /DNA_END=914 /DNA_ORIENTATION=-